MRCDIVKTGIFKKELKNRFLCIVEVDGTEELCYIPSSCKLSNFIDMADRTVLLRPIQSPKTRTENEVFAVLLGRQFVVLHLSSANNVVIENLNKRRFSYLGKRRGIRKECRVEGYKCDAFVEDTRTIVEIKSMLSLDKNGLFPTVYSQRAIDQLTKLNLLLERGYHVCYIFVSMNPKTDRISINKEMDEYQKLLYQCINKGMIIKGYSLKFSNDELRINKEITVEY